MHGFFNRSLSWSWDETSPRVEPASIFMKSHQRAVKRAESRRQLTLSSTLKKKSFTQTSIKIDDGAWELVIKRDRARLVNSFSVDSVFNTPCCFYSKSVYLNVDNFLTSLCWFLIALPIKSKYVWERIVSFFFFFELLLPKETTLSIRWLFIQRIPLFILWTTGTRRHKVMKKLFTCKQLYLPPKLLFMEVFWEIT